MSVLFCLNGHEEYFEYFHQTLRYISRCIFSVLLRLANDIEVRANAILKCELMLLKSEPVLVKCQTNTKWLQN